MDIHALQNISIRPFSYFCLEHSFWNVHLDTLISTWVGMAGLAIFVFFARKSLDWDRSVFANLVEKIVGMFANSMEEAFGKSDVDCTGFLIGILFFTLACNFSGLLPFLKEATLDLNTTLAISVICFCYVQYQSIMAKKISYVTKFFQPIFIFFPVNVAGQLAKILSLNFRLFGNILSGAIIWGLLYQLLTMIRHWFCIAALVILPLGLLFKYFVPEKKNSALHKIVSCAIRIIQLIPGVLFVFGFIEGMLQAFLVALLTSMYISGEVDKTNESH